ncbi:Thyn1 [Scenedesmus sp. PABB004]|nr:Thyn1 [Scenedesmus sp. PABB004]
MARPKRTAATSKRDREEGSASESEPEEKPKRSRKPSAKPKQNAAQAEPGSGLFLIKSEPHEFSWDDLEARPNQTEGWDGVRNAEARNIMREMRVGDQALFYHSNCKTPGCVGVVEVVREAYPDASALDAASKYYDAKSSAEGPPRWWMVDVRRVRALARPVLLEELKTHKDGGLAGMALFTRPRLSVQRVSAPHWAFITGLEATPPPPPAAKAKAKPKAAEEAEEASASE